MLINDLHEAVGGMVSSSSIHSHIKIPKQKKKKINKKNKKKIKKKNTKAPGPVR